MVDKFWTRVSRLEEILFSRLFFRRAFNRSRWTFLVYGGISLIVLSSRSDEAHVGSSWQGWLVSYKLSEGYMQLQETLGSKYFLVGLSYILNSEVTIAVPDTHAADESVVCRITEWRRTHELNGETPSCLQGQQTSLAKHFPSILCLI